MASVTEDRWLSLSSECPVTPLPCHHRLVSSLALVDTHCHFDLPAFATDREAVLVRAGEAGVRSILVPAIRPATWGALELLARPQRSSTQPRVALAIGVHPQVVPSLTVEERLVATDSAAIAAAAVKAGAVAIGECGLDGETGDMETQIAVFEAHLRAARLLSLPLVVHLLRTHHLAPRLLADAVLPKPAGVLHSYSGGAALVPIYRDQGFAFSFAGPVTYPNARRPLESARAVPGALLLAETDAPDQVPFTHRGGRSEPAYVRAVVAGLAAARGESFEETAALTSANAQRIFGL